MDVGARPGRLADATALAMKSTVAVASGHLSSPIRTLYDTADDVMTRFNPKDRAPSTIAASDREPPDRRTPR